MSCKPSEQANSTSNKSSVDRANSYTFGILTIVLNMILCFITTKMLPCEQFKKYLAPEDIVEAHIIIELSDARRPSLTT